jgi:hypothetical protein
MQSIFEDKNKPWLFRLEAAYTLAVLHYARDERHKCEDIYHHAISIGEKKLKKEKDIKNEETLILMTGEGSKKTMKEIMEGLLNDCKTNLAQLNMATRGAPGTVFTGVSDNPIKKSHRMPIGRGGTTLTNNQINNLIDVGGIRCDYCKCDDKKLSKCSLCNRGFYCSKECQKKQWNKRGHKTYCRKKVTLNLETWSNALD